MAGHEQAGAAVRIRQVTVADLDAITGSLEEFWDDRAREPGIRALHHPIFAHEFAATSFVAVEDGGTLAAYLLGLIATAEPVGYVHAVAVRRSWRGSGLARLLYGEFERAVAARGVIGLKAITSPRNEGSIKFHQALGMSAVQVADYAGPGRDRVVFRRPLRRTGRRGRPTGPRAVSGLLARAGPAGAAGARDGS